ncbi:MAG: tetratricopeptide repeat protein [Chloroflexi bacterium]|nr:tetratricopeptide repeat protein [Chloroflexota bacterium]
MSKKAKGNKPATKAKGSLVDLKQLDRALANASQQLIEKDYKGAIFTVQRVLRSAPPASRQRVDAFRYLGVAQVMQKNATEAYEAFTEGVKLAPDDAELWFNRGLTSRYTSRIGQSLQDFERAAALPDSAPFQDKLEEELSFSRELVTKSLESRGHGFTLEQLLVQESLFQQGVKYQGKEQWSQAEQVFRQLIEMGDVLPQPWLNLGMSLIMQKRYDEGEAALKRALEIDPNYTYARDNLEHLPEIRRTGVIKSGEVRDPFKAAGIKTGISFYQ